MAERAAVVREYEFAWPVMDAATTAGLMRWLILVLVLVGLLALVSGFVNSASQAPDERDRPN
jgi:hypothetical protein